MRCLFFWFMNIKLEKNINHIFCIQIKSMLSLPKIYDYERSKITSNGTRF